MTPKSSHEAALDAALAEALFTQPNFARWLLGRTRFGDEAADCVFCRFDNPWSTVRLDGPNSVNGEMEVLVKQCETDVLAVFQTTDGRRLALHIENKLANGSFTHLQPELYKARLQQWKNRPKLGQYTDATSMLIAPEAFFARYRTQLPTFETCVSHEDIGLYLHQFKQAPGNGTD